MQIHLVPYSEHSSYLELREYVKFLKPQEVLFLLNMPSTVMSGATGTIIATLLATHFFCRSASRTCIWRRVQLFVLCSSYRQWGAAVARRLWATC